MDDPAAVLSVVICLVALACLAAGILIGLAAGRRPDDLHTINEHGAARDALRRRQRRPHA